MTADELRAQIRSLSAKLDNANTDDIDVLEQRIELRGLLNRLDIAVIPVITLGVFNVDLDALIEGVDKDLATEAGRVNLIASVGKVVGFVRSVV